ncbi:hypothetical protein OAK75_10315 [Bacteriovoracales bacterium]|nr:hypothetical protein [Bacteriovoracales bacterium]
MLKRLSLGVIASLMLLVSACHNTNREPTQEEKKTDKVDSFVEILSGNEGILDVKVLKDLDNTETEGWIVLKVIVDESYGTGLWNYQEVFAVNLDDYEEGDSWSDFVIKGIKNNPTWVESNNSDDRGFCLNCNVVKDNGDGTYSGGIYSLEEGKEVDMTFSEVQGSAKDLEKLAAFKETYQMKKMQDLLTYDFGLSEKRSENVAKLVLNWKRVSKNRAMSNADADAFSKSLIGVNINEATQAFKKSLEGDKGSFEGLIEKAAEVNGTSPENMKSLLDNLLLK